MKVAFYYSWLVGMTHISLQTAIDMIWVYLQTIQHLLIINAWFTKDTGLQIKLWCINSVKLIVPIGLDYAVDQSLVTKTTCDPPSFNTSMYAVMAELYRIPIVMVENCTGTRHWWIAKVYILSAIVNYCICTVYTWLTCDEMWWSTKIFFARVNHYSFNFDCHLRDSAYMVVMTLCSTHDKDCVYIKQKENMT